MIDYLWDLDRRSDEEYESDKSAYQHTCETIKEIGSELHRRGGENLMRNILLIAGSEGCNIDFIGREWNGIGAWQG
ncbi:MAG: hypothetical protein A2Z16_16655 [Chloroflexi bacterium RBG_16_54_18]|nr:MAG: hypothetical protein A2Z16_16655 [Chloroflexi bacterium RBG_16_54_18]